MSVHTQKYIVVALCALLLGATSASPAAQPGGANEQPAAPKPRGSAASPPGSLAAPIVAPETPQDAAAPKGAPAGASGDEEMPPVSKGEFFTESQIRWCLAQRVRIDTVRPVLNRYDQEEVRRFNGQVADLNARCSSYRYYGTALQDAKDWLEAERPRIEREARDTHIAAAAQTALRRAKPSGAQQKTQARTAPPKATQETPSSKAQEGPAPRATQDSTASKAPQDVAPKATRETAAHREAAAAAEAAAKDAASKPPGAAKSTPAQPGAAVGVVTEPPEMPVREAASKPAAPATEAAPRGPAVQSEAPVSAPPRHADASGRPAGVSGAPEAPAPVPAQAQPPLPALPEPVAPAQVAAAAAASSSAKDSKTEPQAAVPSAAAPPHRELPPAAAPPEAQPAPASATDSRGKTASTAAANTAPATGRDAALAKLTQEVRQVGSLVLDRPDSGADATAQLEVHYASGGYISSIVIAQSSGSPALDDQALGYARAMRLPNAPQELRGQEFVVSFPIVFRGR